MNVNLLIDSMVRQTTVLIAQMATTAGARAPLAHTANRVFLDLTRELKQQGLGNKVISDMFGLTLRAYHAKVARLSESGTERGRSLWEAILEFVREKGDYCNGEEKCSLVASGSSPVKKCTPGRPLDDGVVCGEQHVCMTRNGTSACVRSP